MILLLRYNILLIVFSACFIFAENIHVVEKGDTLFNISKRYNVTIDDIQRWNNITNYNIKIGQKLIIQPLTVKKVKYKVKRGETLWRIAWQNGITVKELLDLNKIKDISSLKAGEIIYIPVKKISTEKEEWEKRNFKYTKTYIPNFKINLPVKGKIEDYNKGVRIFCPVNSEVKAVLDGDVEYTGILTGYRNIIILRHKDEMYSVYAGLDKVFVSAGDYIKENRPIATVAKLNHYDTPFLYFEFIVNGKNIDVKKQFK